MPKVNFQQIPRTNKMFRHTSNCDSLVRKIKEFYCINQDVISLEDKKQLLAYLQKIEQAKKVLNARARHEMYAVIEQMKYKYRG